MRAPLSDDWLKFCQPYGDKAATKAALVPPEVIPYERAVEEISRQLDDALTMPSRLVSPGPTPIPPEVIGKHWSS
jgi:hypothetical protein